MTAGYRKLIVTLIFRNNHFELRMSFRLTNEGFDTWHPLWIYSQCPQAFMSKSTFFHFELSSGALSFTFYEYVFRFLILIFNLIISADGLRMSWKGETHQEDTPKGPDIRRHSFTKKMCSRIALRPFSISPVFFAK